MQASSQISARESTRKNRVNQTIDMETSNMLPNLMATPAGKDFQASFMDFKSTDSKNTSEVLFMKRLLYLKASLDNEN
jgi:hypothetical protein